MQELYRAYRNPGGDENRRVRRCESSVTFAYRRGTYGEPGTVLKSLLYQFFHGDRTPRGVAFHHLFHVLGDEVGFEIDGISGLQRSQIGHLHGVRDDGDGASRGAAIAFEFRDGKTD